MIEINQLNFTYPGAKEPSLRDLSLKIETGRFVAIVGHNGCGKSTLCKTLNGLIPHFFDGDYSGEVRIDGERVDEKDIPWVAQKVGYVYQDFENQILRPRVLDDASYACLNYAVTDFEQRGREALRCIGLGDQENAYVFQLSGGQRHLLALAGVLALGPDILILDEPIAQLDPHHGKMVYKVLKKLQIELGKTILVIEHHTEFIAAFCDEMVMMKEGGICWHLPVKEGLNRLEDLQASRIFPPQITEAAWRLRQKGRISKAGLLPVTVEEGRKCFAGLSYRKTWHQPAQMMPKTCLIRFHNVSLQYPTLKGEAYTATNKLDLDIHKHDRIALVGTNGAGKSTLLKLLMGILKPTEGRIEWFDGLSRSGLAYVYQNPEEMFIMDCVEKDILYGLQARRYNDAHDRAARLLDRFNLEEVAQRDARLLSGGQMRRAALAIGVALEPKVLLLDEPTANLDVATKVEIIRVLEEMQEGIEATIIATHDMQLVAEWATRIIVMDGGRIIADGNRETIFFDDAILKQAGIEAPSIHRMGRELYPEAQCFTIESFVERFGEVS